MIETVPIRRLLMRQCIEALEQRIAPAIFIWDGGGGADQSWFNPLNWDRDTGVPGGADTAILNNGGTINVTDDTTVGAFEQMNGTFTGAALTILQRFDWSGGAQNGSGATTLPAGSIAAISGDATKFIAQRTFNVGGTMTWSGAGKVDFNSGTFNVLSGAIFDVRNDLTFDDQDGTGTPSVFNSAGTVRKSAGSQTTTFGPSAGFFNSGTLEVQSGTVAFSIGSFHNSGAVQLQANTGARLGTGGQHSGTFNAATGALIDFSGGTHLLNAGSSFSGAGVTRLSNGTVEVAGGATVNATNFDFAGGTQGGAGTLNVTQASTWSAGTLSGSGATTWTAGSTVFISGDATKFIGQRTLNVGGTMTWSGGGKVDFNSGTFNVLSGAIFDVRNDLTFDDQDGGGTPSIFNNAGTVRKSAGSQTTTFGPSGGFFNSGTLEVQSGTVAFSIGSFHNSGAVQLQANTGARLGTGGQHSGTFNAATGALIDFSGGTHLLNAGSSFSGAGVTRLSNGTVEVAGGATVNATNFDFAGGTQGGAGTLNVTQASTWSAGTLSGSGATTWTAGSTVFISGDATKFIGQRTLNVGGNMTWSGGGKVDFNSGTFNVLSGAIFDVQNDLTFDDQDGGGTPSIFNNAGTVRKSATSQTTTFGPSGGFFNAGVIEARSGTLHFSGPFSQAAGSTVLTGGAVTSTDTLLLNGGTLEGIGTIGANVNNSGAILRPGGTGTTGTLIINGSYSQGPAGTFAFEVAGSGAAQFDRLDIRGNATLAGTLHVDVTGGFIPRIDDRLRVILSTNNPGTFDALAGDTAGIAQQPDAAGLLIVGAGTVFTWDGSDSSDWFDPNNWTPAIVPGPLDTIILGAVPATGALSLLGQFSPALGSLVGVAFDPIRDRVLTYASFAATIDAFTTAGVAAGSFARPGAAADDVDLDIAPIDLTLGGTFVPAGSLFYIDGESGAAEIYAIDPATGGVIASVNTLFGSSHVVGGAFHSERKSFFLVTDRLDAVPNTIAEVDAATGAVLNTFSTGGFNVNFGDVDIREATGNLILVSSIQSSVRELTPTGGLVQDRALPVGVNSLSGIGFDDGRDEAVVSSTNGDVYRLGAFAALTPNQPVLNANATVGTFQQSSGNLSGTGALTVQSEFLWSGGTQSGTGQTEIPAGATMTISGTPPKTLQGRTLNIAGSAFLTGTGQFILADRAAVQNRGDFDIGSDADFVNGGTNNGTFTNATGSTFHKSGGVLSSDFIGIAFSNSGTVRAEAGTIQFLDTFTQTGGFTFLAGGQLGTGSSGRMFFEAGTLTGAGAIVGDGEVSNSGATFFPGDDGEAGILSIAGNYIQGAGGTLWIDLAGTTPGSGYDQLIVGGTATLAGQLNIDLIDEFTPQSGSRFAILPYASRVGTFGTLTGDSAGLAENYTATGLLLEAGAGPGATLRIGDAAETEGQSGTTIVTFTVTLSEPLPQVVTVQFLTADRSATVADNDYLPAAGVLTFAPNELSATFSVTVNSDLRGEPRERFVVTLSNATNAGISDGEAAGIIRDDDHHLLAIGDAKGSQVRVFDATSGALTGTFTAFEDEFRGGVRVATGDVNGDGVKDIIAGAGISGGGRVRVFDGRTFAPLPGALGGFDAFGHLYRGGVHVAAGDVNDDGLADVIVSPSAGSSGQVRIFDGSDGSELSRFNAFGKGSGGVRVAAGDINGDGRAEIIAGSGIGSTVRIFDALAGTILAGAASEARVFAKSYRGGIYVAAGDVDGDGLDDVIAGTAAGEKLFKIYPSSRPASPGDSHSAYSGAFRGVRVATVDVNSDGLADIITAKSGGDSRVTIFQGNTLENLLTLSGYPARDKSGVFVG